MNRHRSIPLACILLWAAASTLAAQIHTSGGSSALPLRILAERADAHLMVYFDGHPEFEAVEAFITQTGYPAGQPFIRAILTRHGGQQDDYVNQDPLLAVPPANSNGRTTNRVPISLRQSPDRRDWLVSFPLADQQTLALVYLGDTAPDSAYGGLTDPGTHAVGSALPFMYREASGMGSAKSYVRIGDRKYPAAKDPAASRPPFFFAFKAYLTNGFQSLILPVFHDSVALSPVGDPIPRTGDSAGLPCLEFDPPLPDPRSLRTGQSVQCRFALVPSPAEESPQAVRAGGMVLLDRTDETQALIRVLPSGPAWAVQRAITYRLDWSSGRMGITAAMGGQ